MRAKRETVIPIVTGVAGLVLGSVVGWISCSFRSKKTIEKLLETIEKVEAQIAVTDELEQKMNELGEALKDRTKEIHKVSHILEELPGQSGFELEEIETIETIEETSVVVNLFEREVDDGWNWEEELAYRQLRSGHPYTITVEEYEANESGYTQTTITFYEGDEVLCDEHDVPIYNPGEVTGPILFGKGSKDPNLVYVRNDKIQSEYEIIRDDGFYLVEVLGQTIEEEHAKKDLKHSGDRKFRDWD